MVNTPEEAKYYAIKSILDDNGFKKPILENGKLIILDIAQKAVLESKEITEEHKQRYIKEKGLIDPNAEGREALTLAYFNIKKIINAYLDIPEEHKTIIALWIIGTHMHDEFESYPYLFLNAMRGSGKTRCLKLISALAKNGQLLASLTEAVLFRTTGMLAIDEFESLGSKDKQALRELLNASYKKGVKIIRMKKKKTMDGEEQVAEYFEPYRPICMANIWGIEEVLGDRCISLTLEKSNQAYYTKMIEDFSKNPIILEIYESLKPNRCSLCSVVMKKNIITTWNNYIKSKYITTLHTLTTLTPFNALITQEDEIQPLNIGTDDLELCNKIDATGLDGRHLELYFPLFMIAKTIDESVFEEVLNIAQKMVHDKRIDEVTESKDVLVYRIVSTFAPTKYTKISEITSHFRLMIGEGEADWLNSKWIGRALKRLNLIIDRRRTGDGMEVTLNIDKAKEKLEMFDK